MIGNQSKYIITGLSFNVILPPYFREDLFEIIHSIVAWKYHMKDVFIPF